MKKLKSHLIGIDEGVVTLFSDFADEGEMWSEQGPREKRVSVEFSETFSSLPTVRASISMWDVDTSTPLRADLEADNITASGFEILFRTWGDSRFARLRASWIAIGEIRSEDDWSLY